MLKPEEGSDMATQSGLADRVRNSMCFQSLLGFFFNKGVRGGPRVLLNLAGVLVALIIFVKLLPQRMAESALQSIPQGVWPSLGSPGNDGTPVGLRIVVFGEIDIGTPVGADEEMIGSKTWTQALCDQVSPRVVASEPPGGPPWDIKPNFPLPRSLHATTTFPWCRLRMRLRGPSAPTSCTLTAWRRS